MIPDVRLLRVNRDRRICGQVIKDHSHNYYEFVYYLNADGSFLLDGEERRIKTGRFTVIRPNTPHSEYHKKDGIVFFCVFESDAVLENCIYDDDADGTVLRLCNSVSEEFFHPRAYSNELLGVIFKELILRIMRWKASAKEIRKDISYAAEYIERSFRENIDLRMLASDIGYGYDHFHHLFKKKYGLSPKRYQQKCRMECAKQLLLSENYSCTEVAYLSGFYDSAQFSVLFKREFGITPSEYFKKKI